MNTKGKVTQKKVTPVLSFYIKSLNISYQMLWCRLLCPPTPLPQVCGEHAVRGTRHLRLPRGLALGAAARPGPRHAGEERRHNLLHHTDLHLHARAGPAAALQCGWGHLAGRKLQPAEQQQPGAWLQRLRPQQHLQRRSHILILRRCSSCGLLTHTGGHALQICLERKIYQEGI